MRLHQINQLNYTPSIENMWRKNLQAGDKILLIEDGILRTNTENELEQLIKEKQVELVYLQSDAIAYGLTPNIGRPLSDDEWVEITFSADANISW